VNILLEVASGLRRTHCAQLVYWRFEKLSDVFFDLLADVGLLQSLEQFFVFDVGKSPAKRALHDIVIDHGHPRVQGNRGTKKTPLSADRAR
jgi:hypothetical protein